HYRRRLYHRSPVTGRYSTVSWFRSKIHAHRWRGRIRPKRRGDHHALRLVNYPIIYAQNLDRHVLGERFRGTGHQIWHAHYLTYLRHHRLRSDIHPTADESSYTPELATEATRAQVSTLTSTQTIIEADESTVPARRINFSLAAPSVVLALITICLGLGAQFLLALTGIAAEGLYDTTQYVQAVLSP